MPNKILLAARFKVCEKCGFHGRIIFSDDSEGREAMSKLEALFQLEQANLDGKLLDVEIFWLEKQILDSTLLLVPPDSSSTDLGGFLNPLPDNNHNDFANGPTGSDKIH